MSKELALKILTSLKNFSGLDENDRGLKLEESFLYAAIGYYCNQRMMSDMDYPEYLNLFQSTGEYRIRVKFKDFSKVIGECSVRADEITKLINPETGEYYSKMYFDDWLCDANKYEIDPKKKLLTIKALMTSSSFNV